MAQKTTIRTSFVLAFVVVGLLNVLGVSDCARVDDSVIAPEAQNATTVGEREQCVEWCDRTARKALLHEQRGHERLLEECGGDPDCRAAEEERHDMAMARIQMKHEKCLEECHDQGGGSGGQ
jgi:hypothetical protein